MARYKCAYNCENSGDADIKYFKFPLYNARKLKKWLVNMKWEDWTPTRFSVLCINHFEDQYINRAGKSVTLRDDAVPTLFSENTQKEKPSITSRRKRNKPAADKATKKDSAQSNSNTTAKQSSRSKEQSPAPQNAPRDARKPERWRVVMDEKLMKIKSFPHFFHGDYCVPQSIHWAPDDGLVTEQKDCDNLIEVKEPWQWLGLDVRGPFAQTHNGHRYILTVADLYSKWVEAVPMNTCLPHEVAKSVEDVIAHFGYPVRILSRLPHDVVQKINLELKEKLKVSIPLLVHHQQTGTADMNTLQMIDRMVSDLMEQHAADWDVYLPAQVFGLCFREHPHTKERPFSALCCKGPEPVRSARGLDLTYSQIRESVFVIR
ncbi:uncharacterized protein LOC115387101 [Salarias fasciatus]|uniref:uncharacterized protein LOC115387101 n=1 Tax=Salarias fasciatus TaxID=181472 RepID=UPI0011769CB4|nr:uncharacterized protein LOC115387101 [Salarias fasciatus]